MCVSDGVVNWLLTLNGETKRCFRDQDCLTIIVTGAKKARRGVRMYVESFAIVGVRLGVGSGRFW